MTSFFHYTPSMTEQDLHKHVRHFHQGNRVSNKYLLSVDTLNDSSHAYLSNRDQACYVCATVFLSGLAKHIRFSYFPNPEEEIEMFTLANGEIEVVEDCVQSFIDEKQRKRRAAGRMESTALNLNAD